MPTLDARVSMPLTGFVRSFPFDKQKKAGLIVAPKESVPSAVGTYKIRGQELADIHISDAAGDRSKANEIGAVVTGGTYETYPYSLGWFVSEREMREAAMALQPLKHAALSCAHALLLRHEVRVQTLAAATANATAIAPD
ncbi:unnamed protein product, partial [marine sediment metagenome]